MANTEYRYNGNQAHAHDDEGDDSDDSAVSLANKRGADGSTATRPPPKKRNRAALSCTLCRERKVKCDRVIPCQQCIKRGDTEFCRLDPNKRGPQGRSSSGHARKHPDHRDSHSDHTHASHSPTHTYPPASYPNVASVPSPSSAAEVDAIKARLAQLEQALAQQQGSTGNSPAYGQQSQYPTGFSPMATSTGLGPSSTSRMSWSTSGSGTGNGNGNSSNNHTNNSSSNSSLPTFTAAGTPANQFAPSQRSSSGSSMSQNIPGHPKLPSFFSQQGLEEGSVGRLPPLASTRSPSIGRNFNMFDYTPSLDGNKPRRTESNDGQGPNASILPASSFSGVSHPFVKENSVETNRSGNHARGDVDSDTEDAALVLEGLAMGAGRGECDEKKAKTGHSIQDVIEKLPAKSIQGYVEDDKAKDIMSEGRYQMEEPKQGRTSKHKMLGALADAGLNENGECQETNCETIAELLKQDPDAEFGPDGKRVTPAMRVCILLSRHENSLFNLVYGPETFLGWGMGWAFAAAEAAGDMMKVSEVVGCKGALQREAVLRAIIRSLPDEQSANHLVDVYDSRVKFLAGNCIHLPTFRKEMAAFYALGTVEKRARVINFVDPGWLSVFLMILVLSLHFHPCERPDSVMHFFDGRTIHLWRSAAQTSLVLARYQSSSSMAVLQSIILINLYLMGTGKKNMNLQHIGITNAIEMGLHRLGAKDKQPKEGENPGVTIRREIAKRIWHYFVIADWCSAPTTGGIYRIQPTQFNTPQPGNYNDEDLNVTPLPPPRPSTEHTDMTFLLQKMQVAIVIRENIDMLFSTKLDNARLSCADTGYLDGRYRGLLEQAPSFYRIGSTEGENTNTEIERWLFQQYVFDKLLRLHRPNLSSKAGARTSCVLLARSILDMQRRIRSRCSVVDRLFTNLGQSFSAAIVLCLDLLQTPPSAAMRKIVRGEISEALKALRHIGASHHGTANNVQVIEALLEEEEARWKQNGERAEGAQRKQSGPMRKKNLLNLALRVAKAARGEEQFKPTTEEGHEADQNSLLAAAGGQSGLLSTESAKDQQSRELMEQLVMGRPTYDEPSSFSLAAFQTGGGGGTQPPGSTNFLGIDDMNISQSFAPMADDNQPFDLSKFLAECDNNSSPGSVSSGGMSGNTYDQLVGSGASDSGHSSLHNGGRANSSASSARLSHSNSHQSLSGPGSENTSPGMTFRNTDNLGSSGVTATSLPAVAPTQGLSPNAPEQSTGLDGFWNWILTQGSLPGSNTAVELAAPLGQASQQSDAQMKAQAQDFQSSYAQNVSSHFQDLFARTLASESNSSNSNNGKKQSIDVSASAPPSFPPSFDGTQPTPAQLAAASSRSQNSFSRAASNTNNASLNSDAVLSVGTPSAGMGSSWMSTPGLFEFAYELGGNDGAIGYPNAQAPSQ